MLPVFILLGLFDASAGNPVTVPAERVITVQRQGGFFTAAQTLDPSALLPYEVELKALLVESEAFTTKALALTPASDARGFVLRDDPPYAPIEVSNTRVRFWATVDGNKRGANDWNGQGTPCGIEVTAATDADPPSEWQKTIRVVVAQQ